MSEMFTARSYAWTRSQARAEAAETGTTSEQELEQFYAELEQYLSEAAATQEASLASSQYAQSARWQG